MSIASYNSFGFTTSLKSPFSSLDLSRGGLIESNPGFFGGSYSPSVTRTAMPLSKQGVFELVTVVLKGGLVEKFFERSNSRRFSTFFKSFLSFSYGVPVDKDQRFHLKVLLFDFFFFFNFVKLLNN